MEKRMKERPIIFSGSSVRSILEGRETVTRRVIKVQPHGLGAWIRQGIKWMFPNVCPHTTVNCPYGQPGDRLWVREAWSRVGNTDPGYLTYRATYPECLPPGLERVPADIRDVGYRWRPSIHMPRAASRILLEITDVRVERLQDISDEQALAEGVDQTNTSIPGYARQRFQDLWGSINGTGSWDANPWVWVVEFKRIQP